MGTFLAIGLATQIILEKEQLEKYQIFIEQVQEEIEQQLHHPAEIYGYQFNMGQLLGWNCRSG